MMNVDFRSACGVSVLVTHSYGHKRIKLHHWFVHIRTAGPRLEPLMEDLLTRFMRLCLRT
jgi:hypothetical protein